MDFTIKTYRKLLLAIKEGGYEVITFEQALTNPLPERCIILRHDVDEKAHNALAMAQEEQALGIHATYYFRVVKQSNQPEVIRAIAAMGHEVGYHYEDLSTANGDYAVAIQQFEKHLAYFRTFYPVRTVCMHGGATSKHNNCHLWQQYQLADYGLIGEPYLSLDFSKIYYLTDSGRMWDGGKYVVRDIVENPFGLTFHATNEIINTLQQGKFPKQSMILAHTLWSPTTQQWLMLTLRERLRNKVKVLSKKNKLVAKIYKILVRCYWSQGKQ